MGEGEEVRGVGGGLMRGLMSEGGERCDCTLAINHFFFISFSIIFKDRHENCGDF